VDNLPTFLCSLYILRLFAYYSLHRGSYKANPNSGFGQAPATPGKANGSAPERVKLDGYAMVIYGLETEMDYLRRAKRYLEQK
jgi:hypothetical protein